MRSISTIHAYGAQDRPVIEVSVGRCWLPGRLRSWIERDAEWWAHIDYALASDRTYTTTVPACRIRSTDPRARTPGRGSDNAA